MKRLFLILFYLLLCAPAAGSFAAGPDMAAPDLGIRVHEGRVSMDVRDADMGQVLKELARKAGIHLSLDPGMRGKITMKMTGVPVESALKALCKNRAVVFEYRPETRTYKVVQVGAFSSETGKNRSRTGDARRPDRQADSGPLPADTGGNRTTPDKEKKTEKMYDAKGRRRYLPGELLVRFKKGVTRAQIAALMN